MAITISRRHVTAMLGVAGAAWPFPTRGQRPDQNRRVGVLMSDAESDQEGQLDAQTFRNSLQELGWTEGHNVQIDFRWAAGDAGRFHELAKELVAIQPGVIVARSTPATAALKAETRTIPIIFITVSDPIGSKIIGIVINSGRKRF